MLTNKKNERILLANRCVDDEVWIIAILIVLGPSTKDPTFNTNYTTLVVNFNEDCILRS